jgi:hypothetical protein
MSVVYRTAEPDDINFVTNTWMTSFRDSDTAGFIAKAHWPSVAETEIRRILSREGVELYIAANPNGNKELKIDIHGWIAVERGFHVPGKVLVDGKRKRVMKLSVDPLVHYCFVKPVYRRNGLAKGLFAHASVDPSEPFYYSCKTQKSSQLSKLRKIPGGRHEPRICRFHRNHNKERRFDESNPIVTSKIQQRKPGGTGPKFVVHDFSPGPDER